MISLACDMAGPGFDPIAVDHSKAGKNVQCFHSSRDKGTLIHSCHRNIMFGSCGLSQPSVASQLHLGSHGLCVDIYINTFDYPFYALKSPPSECISFTTAAKIPNDYTVGYEEHFNKYENNLYFYKNNTNYTKFISFKYFQASYWKNLCSHEFALSIQFIKKRAQTVDYIKFKKNSSIET